MFFILVVPALKHLPKTSFAAAAVNFKTVGNMVALFSNILILVIVETIVVNFRAMGLRRLLASFSFA